MKYVSRMVKSENIKFIIIGSIVYNRIIVYNRQSFLKVVVHVIIIDQFKDTFFSFFG